MKRLSSAKLFKPRKRMMIIFILLLFILGLPQLGRESGADAGNKKKESLKSFVKDWLTDEFKIWTSPFRIKKKSLLFLGGAALATAFLIKNDTAYHDDIQAFVAKSRWVRESSPIFTELGSTTLNMGLIGSFYLGGLLLKNDRARTTGRLSLMSLMHTYVVTQVLKRIFRRQRPYVEHDIDRWFVRENGKDYRSFPSGHSSTAWSVATVIAGMYKDKPAVPVICYSLASLASLSRLTENKHRASDVLAGAVLGYAIGRFVLRRKNPPLTITPMIASDIVGIRVYYVF